MGPQESSHPEACSKGASGLLGLGTPIQVVSGDVRDASSPSTKEDLGWEGSGQGGEVIGKEVVSSPGACMLGPPHRYLEGGTGESTGATPRRGLEAYWGLLTRIWVRARAWTGFGAFRCGVESCQPYEVRLELPWG